MAKVRKTLVPYGTHQSPQGPVNVTPERVRKWVDTHQRMTTAGLKVPVPWGHQHKALPLDPADPDESAYLKSRYNAGYLEALETGPEGLEGVLDLPALDCDGRGNLIDRASRTAINEVSVGIDSLTDGRGRTWDDAIVHVALTPWPVVAGQEPFAPAQLSLKRTASPKLVTLAMSPGGFAVGGTKDNAAPPPGASAPEAPADDAQAGGLDLFGSKAPGNVQNLVAQLKAEMAGAGIVLPDHIDGSNVEEFLSHLLTGIATLKAAQARQPAAAAPAREETPQDAPAREEQPQAMYMGLNTDLYRSDAGYKAYWDARRKDAEAGLRKLLDELPGLGCPPGVLAKLKAGARGVRLSLTSGRLEGEAAGQIALLHETLSALPEKARSWLATAKASEAPNPFDKDHESNVKQKADTLEEMKDAAFPARRARKARTAKMKEKEAC